MSSKLYTRITFWAFSGWSCNFLFTVGKSLAEKHAEHTAYMIELNLTVCTYVPLFKGGKLLQLCLSLGLSVCVLCLFSINMNSPTHSLSHIHRAPWERADLREARAWWRGAPAKRSTAERGCCWAHGHGPLGLWQPLCSAHNTNPPCVFIALCIEEQARAGGGGCMGEGGGDSGGGGDTGTAAGPILSASLFEDRQHCITWRYLTVSSWKEIVC